MEEEWVVDGQPRPYRIAVMACTVIITDGYKAVLFTAWSRGDIELEKEEHFGGQDGLVVLTCDRQKELSGWPLLDLGDLKLRRHEVLCCEVPGFMEALGELDGGYLPS